MNAIHSLAVVVVALFVVELTKSGFSYGPNLLGYFFF